MSQHPRPNPLDPKDPLFSPGPNHHRANSYSSIQGKPPSGHPARMSPAPQYPDRDPLRHPAKKTSQASMNPLIMEFGSSHTQKSPLNPAPRNFYLPDRVSTSKALFKPHHKKGGLSMDVSYHAGQTSLLSTKYLNLPDPNQSTDKLSLASKVTNVHGSSREHSSPKNIQNPANPPAPDANPQNLPKNPLTRNFGGFAEPKGSSDDSKQARYYSIDNGQPQNPKAKANLVT